MIAADYADLLAAAGAIIVGPFSMVSKALEALEGNAVDVAVVDFVLADGSSGPLQEALERKQVPFVLVTAYPRVLVRRNEDQVIHAKPITDDRLCSAIADVLQR